MSGATPWSDCRAGSKTRRSFPVVARADGTEVAMPMLVAQGGRPGKTLLVSAGIHGDEFEGMAALWRVFDQLDSTAMRGTLVAVPIVNSPAYEAGLRTNADDRQDLARVFDGDPVGTVTEQIAHAFAHQFIAHADLYCDLHSAGQYYAIEPLVGYGLVEGPTLEVQRAAARLFGMDLVWGTVPLPGRSLSAARTLGVPALYAEVNGAGACQEEDVARYQFGVLQLMRFLGILSEPPEPFVPKEIVEDPRENSGSLQIQNRAPVGGFFLPRTRLGDAVEQNAVLGEILKPTGQSAYTVRSTTAGRVVFLRTFPRVKPGDPLLMVMQAPR